MPAFDATQLRTNLVKLLAAAEAERVDVWTSYVRETATVPDQTIEI